MAVLLAAIESERLIDYVGAGAGVVGALAALLVIAAAVRAQYRRTLGRRRDRYGRLGRLGVGAQLSFVASVVGEPPAVRRTVHSKSTKVVAIDEPEFDPALARPGADWHDLVVKESFTECIFLDRDYYLQTISDDDDTVLAYSVTTRRRGFAPTFEAPC
jgi:hypothetical protein